MSACACVRMCSRTTLCNSTPEVLCLSHFSTERVLRFRRTRNPVRGTQVAHCTASQELGVPEMGAEAVRGEIREVMREETVSRPTATHPRGRAAAGTVTVTFGPCALRRGKRFAFRTAGAVWGISASGSLFPPLELADAESTRMVLLAVIKLF
eukprot:365407-Chlamydomonas_euryale.AAC.6